MRETPQLPKRRWLAQAIKTAQACETQLPFTRQARVLRATTKPLVQSAAR